MSMPDRFETELTKKLGNSLPDIALVWGMLPVLSYARLCRTLEAIGTIGAIGMSPEGCRQEIRRLKKMLRRQLHCRNRAIWPRLATTESRGQRT